MKSPLAAVTFNTRTISRSVVLSSVVPLLLYLLFCSIASAADQVSRFAYIANPYDYTLSQYTVDADGLLHANGMTYVADKFPALVSVHPSQQFLYTASRTVDSIRAYRIDPATGWLTEVKGSPFNSKLRSPFYGDFHPSGKFFFLAGRGGGVGAYRVNQKTGALRAVPGQPFKAGERTRSLRVHPSGKFLYATNAYTNNISAYRINPATGVLIPLKSSPFPAGEEGPFDDTISKLPDIDTNKGGLPYNVSIHPDGDFLYVSNFVAGSVSAFRVDQASGALTLLGKPVATGLNPYPTLVHPNGKFLYVAAWGGNNIWVYKIDKQSGALTRTQGSPYEGYSVKPVDFSFSNDGTRLYTSNMGEQEAVVFAVDPDTGALSLKQKIRSREGALDIELVRGNKPAEISPLYAFVLDDKGRKLINYKIDGNSGDFTQVSSVPTGKAPADVAHDPKGRTVYITNTGDDNVTVFRIDPKSGKMERNIGSPHPMGKGPTRIKMDVNGWYVYVLNEQAGTVSMHLAHVDTGELAEAVGSPMKVLEGTDFIALDAMARFSYAGSRKEKKISAYRTRAAITPARYEMKQYGSPFSMPFAPDDFVADPYGRWAVASNSAKDSLSVYTMVFSNGALFEIEGSPFKAGKQPGALAMHPLLPYLYVANKKTKDIYTFSLDNVSGKLTKLHNTKIKHSAEKLYVDPAGHYMYALVTGKKGLLRFKLNANTGKPELQKDIHLDFVPTAMSISAKIN